MGYKLALKNTLAKLVEVFLGEFWTAVRVRPSPPGITIMEGFEGKFHQEARSEDSTESGEIHYEGELSVASPAEELMDDLGLSRDMKLEFWSSILEVLPPELWGQLLNREVSLTEK